MIYETKRLTLKPLKKSDALVLREYLLRNKSFLEKWEPKREQDFFEIESIEKMLEFEKQTADARQAISLYIFKKDDGRLIGNVKLSNIVYGIFLSCFTGYKLDKEEQGKGYMTEALKEVVRIAFEEYGLHRIEANIMPRNKASQKVVKKLGFKKEGKARKYLKINGIWEDHIHYVLLNETIE
jgi:ribosomal-protein-alanine N-acetyltransferase